MLRKANSLNLHSFKCVIPAFVPSRIYRPGSKLDTIGIKVGHLPASPPFSTTFAQPSPLPELSQPTSKRSSLKISKAELLSSLESRDAFYDLYVDVTNRAIDMYTKAGRRKFALKLHGTLAALDLYVSYVNVTMQ